MNARPNGVSPSVVSGDVVCFGFLTHSLLLVVESLPPTNGGVPLEDAFETVGDDAAIVASILTNWRVPARLESSPFGNDYYGQRVREELKSWGVDVGRRLVEGFETPLEVAILDAGGGRTYFQRRDPSALAALKAPSPAELSGAGLLYVDWYDGPSVLTAMEAATAAGVPVYLNLESRYKTGPSLPDLLRHTSICQVSLDEPEATGSPYDAARSMLAQGVETVLVTMGAHGCLAARGSRAFRVRPPTVRAIDCYGAGAAFSAGAIYGLRENWPLERIARFATAYAALKCEVAGIAGLSTSEIDAAAATLEAEPHFL